MAVCQRKRKDVDRYDLELDRCSWHDAKRDDGSSVEIKAAMHRPVDGQPRTFKLYDHYHERLRTAGGYYVFAVYRVRGRGVEVLRWEMRHSSRLPSLNWHGGGYHWEALQSKIAISDVF